MGKTFYQQRLNDLVKKERITKKQLCDDCNVTYGTYLNWVRPDSTMKVIDLVTICNNYNLGLSYFISDSEDKDDIDKNPKDVRAIIKSMSDERLNDVIKYERQISKLQLDNQKEITRLTEEYLKKINALEKENHREIRVRDAEIQKLKIVLASDFNKDPTFYGKVAEDDSKVY